MIKYETIISNFDDKTTLYNWLRKVEEALKNASATNFVVNKKGNATLSFSITFADGTTLESGDIVLQQGESVVDARIASGVLQLQLSNGNWLTAGNIGAVSSFDIDNSQHLIVNYQDGTSQDLGAIFSGSVNITGNLQVGTNLDVDGYAQFENGNFHGDLGVSQDIACNNINVYYKVDAGSVEANEIKEKMTGYSASLSTFETGFNFTKTYVGCVKTGNKITFAIAGTIRRTANIQSYGAFSSVLKFTIPQDVADKLYPKSTSFGYVLATNKLNCFKSEEASVDIVIDWAKPAFNQVEVVLIGLNDLDLNEDYYIRTDVTFLLSDSLL